MKEEEIQKLLNEANNYLQQNDKDNAISVYEKIVEADHNYAEAHAKLADLYFEKGFKEKASIEFLLLGNAYYESRLFKSALKYFQKVLEVNPVCIEARIKAGEIYVSQEMEREAKLEFLAIAEHYLSENDLNKAEEYSKKAIDLKSIEAHYITGLINFKREMWKESAIEFELLTRIKINHTSALLYLGYCYSNISKFTEAISAFEKILKLEPENIDSQKGIGEVYFKKGFSKEGTEHYLRAIELQVKNNLIDEAIKACQELIKYSPTSSEAHEKYADLFKQKGNIKDAVSEYIQAGDLFAKFKLQIKAKGSYSQALSLDPSNEIVKQKLAGSEVGTPAKPVEKEVVQPPPIEPVSKSLPKEEVFETVTPLTSIKGDVQELFDLAEKYMEDSFFEKALEIYRVILKKEPHNMVVRQRLHQAYLLLAQQEEEITKGVQKQEKGPKEKKSKISYL
ncbi:MAG: tetratricopeptide repeat protein [Candidatus Firestonebacteria bacterium]